MPPPSRAIRTPRIFPRIFCAFLRDSGTPIFQAPKRRRKICENGRKNLRTENLRKNGRTKICTPKMGAKICTPKMGAKMGTKICAPKICAKKTGLNIRFVWKMEARKKTHKKKSAPNLRKTPAPSNASEMRQKCVLFVEKEERSKMRQKCVKNARNTFGGEHLLPKYPRAHKIKSALSPPHNPNPPPPKRGILWTWVFLQNGRIFSSRP